MVEDVHALRPGARVGAYEIVRVLGAGGFGITYCARNTVLRRRASVAIKEFFINRLCRPRRQFAGGLLGP